MFELFKIRKARRMAHAAIDPFVRRDPAGTATLQAGDWLQPQIIGFLATLVTLIAQRHCGPMRNHALAAVQSDVLNAVTGIGPEVIGEEICLLSSREDPAFAAGARGAVAFLEALRPPSALDEVDAISMPGDPSLQRLWEEHVSQCL
ncbi:hypothetical protein ACIPIA_13885, partial [Bosea sp. CER48]|uniref:hypothetical protein n=1 Tax=Bosea sp. CER48 TaxID=3377035 RepID=UPI0037F920CB